MPSGHYLRTKRGPYKNKSDYSFKTKLRYKLPLSAAEHVEYIDYQRNKNVQSYNRKSSTPKGMANRLCRQARNRANKAGTPFTITEEWIMERLQTGRCEMTGLAFDFGPPTKRQRANLRAPSLDQNIPSAGYTPENCRLVIFQYNMGKSDGTDDDMYLVAAGILHQRSIKSVPLVSDAELSALAANG